MCVCVIDIEIKKRQHEPVIIIIIGNQRMNDDWL